MNWTGWTHQVDLNKLIKPFNEPNKVLVSLSERFWSWSSRKTEIQTYNLLVVIRASSTSVAHWNKTALLLRVVYMKRITDYREKQIHLLLGYTRTSNPCDYLILWLWWRGGGVSESLSMDPSDIEFHNRVANILRANGGKKGGSLPRGDISPTLQLISM